MAIWDWFKSEDQKKADRAKEVERQQKQRLSDVLRQSMATGNPAQKRAAQTYRTNTQRQAAQTIKKPTQSIWDKTTDIFDANSAMDRYKRLQTNQQELYQDQQRAKGVADSSIETNPLSRGLLTAQKMAEGVIEAPVAFGRSTGSYLGMKSGDYNSALKAEDTNRDVITSKNVEMLRLLNDPTVDTATKQRAINFLNNSDGYTSGMDEIRAKIASDTDPRRMAAAGVSLVADLATLGVAGASKAGIKGAYTAAKAGSTAGRLGQVTTGLVAGAKRFGIDTAKTAGLGSIAGGTSAYIQDPNATFKQAVMGAGMGAAGGAALPTAMIGVTSVPATTRLIGRGATKAVKAIDNLGKPTGEALTRIERATTNLSTKRNQLVSTLSEATRQYQSGKTHLKGTVKSLANDIKKIDDELYSLEQLKTRRFNQKGAINPDEPSVIKNNQDLADTAKAKKAPIEKTEIPSKYKTVDDFVSSDFETAKRINTDYQNRLIQSREVTKNFVKSLDQARKQLDSPSDPYYFSIDGGKKATITRIQDLRRYGGDIMVDIQVMNGQKPGNRRLFNDEVFQLVPHGKIRQTKSPTGMVDNYVQDPNMEMLFKNIPDELKTGSIYPGQFKEGARLNKLVTERQLDESINQIKREQVPELHSKRDGGGLNNGIRTDIPTSVRGNNNSDISGLGNKSNTQLAKSAPVEKTAKGKTAKIEPKDIKTRTMKTADGKTEYVAQLGNTVRDRVGRDNGFEATLTSPNFKTEGELNKWIRNNTDPVIKQKEARVKDIQSKFAETGKITGKEWNENNKLGAELRQMYDAPAAPKPTLSDALEGKSTKPQFGDAKAIKQVKTDSKAGAVLEAKKDRIANKAINTAQPNATSMFDQNELLKKNAQADMFSAKPTVQDALEGKNTKPSIDPEMKQVIDAANQAIKDGDYETAKMLGESLPEKYGKSISKKATEAQTKVEAEVLGNIQKDLAKEVSSDAAENNINTAIKGVTDKLSKHFNAPKSIYKLTGFERTYTTPSGSLKVGGDFKAAFDRTFMTGDITTFNKNIKVLADKYGGTFREIADTLDSGVLDDVDYDKLTGELYEKISKRPAYSRRPSPTVESVSKGNAKTTATGKGIIDDNQKQLTAKPKVAPKKTTVRKAAPQVSEEMALTKTAGQPPNKPPKPPTGNQEIPALGTGKMKKSRFASKTVPESEYVSEPIRKTTKENAPLYAQENEKVRFNQSLTKYEKMGREKFGSDVADRLDVKKGSITSQDVVDAEVLAAKLDAEGKYVEASDIYTKLSGHLTKAGQTVQAAAIMARRSPQGARKHAQKAIEKSGVKFTGGMAKDLNQLTKELASAKTDHDRQFALFLIGEFVKKNTPTSKADRLVNVWRAGLLTSPVTTAGNLMANTGETAIRKGFVNPTATLADALMGKFTGKRTMALAPSGSGTKGFTRGAKTLPEYMKTGFQESDALAKAKYENSGNIHYGDGKLGKALGTYVNGTYRLMGVADAPYRYAGMDEALGSMAKAEALNKGLKGKAQKEFIEQFTKNPPKDALERATKEGYYASFQNDTLLNDMAQGLKQKLERSSRGGPAAKAVSDFVMPFVRTPSAIATRLVERTPVGIAKEMTSQILKVRKGQPFDQRAMAQAIGNGTFGAVAIGAGMTLAQQDLLTFGYPTEQKERDLWEMEGKQPYSVKVGNRWYSMNYLQPFGTLLAIGGQAKKDMDSGASGGEAATKAVATAAQSIQDQSFLKGISGILDMISDPERSARRYMEQTASSIVPNFVRGAARASDDVQRKPTTVGESVASAIPGLRQTTPVKYDALGRPIPAKDNFLNQYVNPTRPSKIRDDALTSELRRLKDDDLATMPTDITKNTYGDQQLSKAQINQATQYTNKRVSDEWSKVVKTKEYQTLTDEQKKKTLDSIKRDFHAVAKAEWAAKNNLINDQYEPKLSAKQKQIAMGETPDYVYGGLPKNLSKTAKDILINSDGKDEQWKNAKSSNKEVQDTIQNWVGDKYQLPKITNYVAEQWAKYEQARADGTLNPIEAETKKKSILKSAFKSEFDDTTRSFYSLGDDAMRNELRKGTISKEQMDKVIAIDNALTELGLQKYAQVGKTLRRELGYGLVSSSGGSGKSGSSRSGGRSRSLGMDYKLFGFGNPQSTTGALRKLLEQTQA